MPQNPPEGYPRISPYLLYRDGAAAIDFLTRAFGFRERMRMQDEQGGVGHAELELDDGVIMLGQPGGDFKSPKELGLDTSLVHVYVDDVDAHFARAKEAGGSLFAEHRVDGCCREPPTALVEDALLRQLGGDVAQPDASGELMK